MLIFATGAAVVALLAGCATSQSVPASPDVLRIGVTPNSPPMIFKQGVEMSGLEADLGRALAAEMGRTPVFIERKWDQLLPAVQTGQVDIVMSNMTITNERKILADFTKPYLQVGQMLLVRGHDLTLYQDPRFLALTNGRIGVEQGTVSDAFVQQNCLRATRVPLSGPDKAINALVKNQIDVFVHDAPVIWNLSSQGAGQGVVRVPTPIGADYLGWAVRRGDSTTLKAANNAIAKWRKNGQLSRMVNRWVPTGN